MSFTVFVGVISCFGAVDKTRRFSAHSKIGNFIIIIIIIKWKFTSDQSYHAIKILSPKWCMKCLFQSLRGVNSTAHDCVTRPVYPVAVKYEAENHENVSVESSDCSSFRLLIRFYFYSPWMRRGNAFGRVCLSVCLYVCPVRAVRFESHNLEASFSYPGAASECIVFVY